MDVVPGCHMEPGYMSASVPEPEESALVDPIKDFSDSDCLIIATGSTYIQSGAPVCEMNLESKPFIPGRASGSFAISKIRINKPGLMQAIGLHENMFREPASEIEIPLHNGCTVVIRAPEGGVIYPVRTSWVNPVELEAIEMGGQ